MIVKIKFLKCSQITVSVLTIFSWQIQNTVVHNENWTKTHHAFSQVRYQTWYPTGSSGLRDHGRRVLRQKLWFEQRPLKLRIVQCTTLCRVWQVWSNGDHTTTCDADGWGRVCRILQRQRRWSHRWGACYRRGLSDGFSTQLRHGVLFPVTWNKPEPCLCQETSFRKKLVFVLSIWTTDW